MWLSFCRIAYRLTSGFNHGLVIPHAGLRWLIAATKGLDEISLVDGAATTVACRRTCKSIASLASARAMPAQPRLARSSFDRPISRTQAQKSGGPVPAPEYDQSGRTFIRGTQAQ